MSSQTKSQVPVKAAGNSARATTPAKRQPKHPVTRPPDISTPRLLSIWRALCVTGILIVTAVMAIGLNRWTAHLVDLSPQNNLLVHLQTVQQEVHSAVDSVPDIALAQQHLEAANQNLNQIGGLTDELDLDLVSTQLIDVTVKIAIASENPSDDATRQLSQALELLNSSLDAGIANAQSALDSSRVLQRLPIAILAGLALLLIVGTSVVTARRTHRVLNLGLLLAAAGMVLAWYLTDQAVMTTTAALSDPTLFVSKIDELNLMTIAVSVLGLVSALAAAYGLRARIKEFR